MIHRMKLKMLYVVGGLILLAAVLLSCDDSLTERAVYGDYFPLDEHSRWEYATAHSYGCRCLDSGLVIRDTLRLHIEEALFVNGPYFHLVDQRTFTYKTVRKVNNRYLEVPAYAAEFMFLDPTAFVGYCWTGNEMQRIKLEITGVNLSKTINGITYDHVIEVRGTNFSLPDETPPRVFSTTFYYYAKDIGLILSRTTYGEPGEQSVIETALLRYWKE
jgi:hypothetical protein